MQSHLLPRSVLIFLLLFAIVAGLYFAKPFLVPFCFAGILSMLLLPVSRRLEKKGWNRALAVLTSILLFLGVLAGIIALLTWQMTDLASDVGKMEQRVKQWGSQVQEYISSTIGISREKQTEALQKQQSSGGGQMTTAATGFLSGVMGFLVDFVLVIVYMFLFMFFRGHLKKFILKVVPDGEEENTRTIIRQASKVGQQYLSGLAIMIAMLWVLYGIGFSIAGLKNALFFAVLCGLLEIIPFIGNLTGTALALLMAVSQGGDSTMIIGILITYALVQFIQTYIIEPLVVGAEVNLNPLFTILILVLGELVWGIPGMVLSIPLLGITKVIFDHVPALKPYGFLIGEEKKKKNDTNWVKKLKGIFKR